MSPFMRRPASVRKSTAEERLKVMQQQDRKSTLLLQFWVLFGMLNAFAAMDIIYAQMLRAFLVLAMLLFPEHTAMSAMHSLFYKFASPLMSGVIPYLLRRCRHLGHKVNATAAPFARVSAGITTLHAVERAPTADLLALEGALLQTRKALVEERRARRNADLKRGMPVR